MKKTFFLYGIFLGVSVPWAVFGAQTIQGFIAQVLNFSYLLFWPFYGIALFFFFWGIVTFIFKESVGDGAREQAKKRMVWGVVALFVLTSVWGIVGFIGSIFGVNQGGACSPTQVTSGGVTSCVSGGGYTAGTSLQGGVASGSSTKETSPKSL